MNFGTKNVTVEERKSLGISYGILKLKLSDFTLTPSANGSGNHSLQFIVEEDAPVGEDGYEYEGLIYGKKKAANKSGRIQFEVPFNITSNETKLKSLQDSLADLGNKTGCRQELDFITADTLEEYLKKVLKVLDNKYAYFVIKAEEYINNTGKISLRRTFKAWKKDANLIIFPANSVVTKEGNTQKIVTPEGKEYTWDKNNVYDYKPAVKPDPDTEPVENPLSFGEPTKPIGSDLPF